MNFTYRGLLAAVFTPFKENMVVNLDIISRYAKFLKDSGVTGVLVNGTTGEGPSLSTSERKVLTEKWKEAVCTTKQHFMVQVGGAPFPDVQELARHAEEIGVDSLLCLPELYFKPKTSAELIEYLKKIGNAAPKTPLLYYHVPSFSDVNLNMGQFMKDIIGKVPTFCGIKFTSSCLDEGLTALRANEGKYSVFLGEDEILAGALTLGFDSAIATTMNILPDLGIKIMEAINESNVKEARKQQKRLNAAIEVISQNGCWVSTMKYAMNILTPITVGGVRSPLSNLSEQHEKEMEHMLRMLDLKLYGR